MVKNMGKKQKLFISRAFEILKPGGSMIYSTCTHSPEENEFVIQLLLDIFVVAKLFPIKIFPLNVFLICKWLSAVLE